MDLFFPNETEAMAISGRGSVHEALEELTRDNDALVVITTGPQGAIAKRGRQVWTHAAFDVPSTPPRLHIAHPASHILTLIHAHAHTHTCTVKDTTGAGDCFTGSFLAQYLQDRDVDKSLALASAAGALVRTLAHSPFLSVGDQHLMALFPPPPNAQAVGREGVPPHPKRAELVSFAGSHALKALSAASDCS
jgi:sugar/nucleoside kinase (ribokinase family)